MIFWNQLVLSQVILYISSERIMTFIQYVNDGQTSNGALQRAWATWIIRKDGANVFQTDDPFYHERSYS